MHDPVVFQQLLELKTTEARQAVKEIYAALKRYESGRPSEADDDLTRVYKTAESFVRCSAFVFWGRDDEFLAFLKGNQRGREAVQEMNGRMELLRDRRRDESADALRTLLQNRPDQFGALALSAENLTFLNLDELATQP
jgi:hypothetical protein